MNGNFALKGSILVYPNIHKIEQQIIDRKIDMEYDRTKIWRCDCRGIFSLLQEKNLDNNTSKDNQYRHLLKMNDLLTASNYYVVC